MGPGPEKGGVLVRRTVRLVAIVAALGWAPRDSNPARRIKSPVLYLMS